MAVCRDRKRCHIPGCAGVMTELGLAALTVDPLMLFFWGSPNPMWFQYMHHTASPQPQLLWLSHIHSTESLANGNHAQNLAGSQGATEHVQKIRDSRPAKEARGETADSPWSGGRGFKAPGCWGWQKCLLFWGNFIAAIVRERSCLWGKRIKSWNIPCYNGELLSQVSLGSSS